MHQYRYTCLLIALLLLPLPLLAKERVGWVESAVLYPGGLTIKAKIDTGATSSSINCNCITPIERNGEHWVRFSITNAEGETQWFERKILRSTKIKRHFGESQERFVVNMGLCLGKTYKETEINLVDRSGLNYQLLIGRRFLEGSHIVDPEATFVSKPSCKGPFLNE
ncbi:MAG: RimK/LysX family protein [Gammaproteobacteria bacterium]